MGMKKPTFDYDKFRETKALEPLTALHQKSPDERMASIRAFMEEINIQHEPFMEQTQEMRVPQLLTKQHEQQSGDPVVYKQKLEDLLNQIGLLVKKLTNEIGQMKRDEVVGLTWFGKLLLKGILWWNGSAKSLFEKDIERLENIVADINECLNILSTAAPCPLSEILQQQCDNCVKDFEKVQSRNLLSLKSD
ncbi:hypothetical protein EXS70_03275 [Candidatus Peribacteria bacterium]|nr:hypothetical protein [Candidatus Peribacteria bacterium]